jgi:hypothetical protein
MVQAITSKQVGLLQFIAANPGVSKDKLVTAKGATDADLSYFIEHDMIREREVGHYRIAHFGELVLKRSL